MIDVLRLQEGIVDLPGVELFWTTRKGGVSDPPFHSWNLSMAVGDDEDAVEENRLRLMAHLPRPPAWLKQVHGASVVCADEVVGDRVDKTEADASYTYTPGVVCAVQMADCLPVFLFHKDGAGVGVAHAGWRGLVAGVLENLVATMQHHHNSPLVAIMGPCIGVSKYVVGDEVYEKLKHGQTDVVCEAAFTAGIHENAGLWHTHLKVLAHGRLRAAGVKEIHLEGDCTYENTDVFFSARHANHQNKKTGRQAAIIYIK